MKEQSAKHFTNVWDRLSHNLAVVAVVLLAAWMGDKDGGYFVGDWTPAAMIVVVLLFVISAAGMLFYNRVGNRWSVLALGLLALTLIAAALFVAFPDLNGVYLAFLNESDAVKALNLALPTVWLTAGAAGLYGVCWGLVDRWWRPPVVAVRVASGVVLAGCMVILIAGAVELNERYSNPAALAQQKWEAFKTSDPTGRNQSRYLSASGSGRYELWRVAWEDFTAHPVLGVGTQNYEATYYQLREQQNVQFVRQPHSLPLEVLGERGVVGGGLFASFLAVCLGVGLYKRYGGRLSSEGKSQIGALVAAVTYWLIHSSGEWFWQIPAVTLPVFVYLAMLVSPWGRDEPAPLGWPLRATGIGVAVLAVAPFAPLYAADRYLEKSQASKNPREALLAVERAQEFNPLNARLPAWEAQLAMQTGDYNRRSALTHGRSGSIPNTTPRMQTRPSFMCEGESPRPRLSTTGRPGRSTRSILASKVTWADSRTQPRQMMSSDILQRARNARVQVCELCKNVMCRWQIHSDFQPA